MDHSFQALAASISAFKERESKRAGRSRLMTIADECLLAISRAPNATTMCEQSGSTTSHPSTSSAGDSPARTSATLASESASTENAPDFGVSTPGLFASYDRASSSWRTSQLCLDGELSEFSETWPRAGMTRNGKAYELPMLVPHTGENESGLWPTPSTKELGGSSSIRKGTNERLQMWPTPNVPSGGRSPKNGMSRTGMTPDGKKRQVGLENAVKMWPTPKAMDGEKTSMAVRGRHDAKTGRDSLKGRVWREMWPTPTAEDSQCKGNHPGAVDSLHAAVKMFPTPTVQDAENDGGPSQFNRHTVPLNAFVKYATPKSSPSGPDYARKNRENSGGDDLATQIGGQLNPTWVEWLMGFPLGWTALKGWATRSSRKSRNTSEEGS